MMTSQKRYASMADIRAANQAAGQHFFERSTMRFFDSRLESGVYGGRHFITSEQFHGSHGSEPRRYTIRVARDDGSIDTAGGHQAGWQAFRCLEDARTFLRAYLKGHATCPLANGKALDLWHTMHHEEA